MGSSAPNIARWFGDIRTYFPSSVVRLMQQDVPDRLILRQMLLQPELLESVEPDVHVVDLTEELHDPVELLFGTQLGGGTDINRALAYCQGLIQQTHDTILVLISDLYEGGNREELIQRAALLAASGAQMIVKLALYGDGAPSFDHNFAAALAGLGIPSFACNPDLFPDLMAAAIQRRDISQWAANKRVVITRLNAAS